MIRKLQIIIEKEGIDFLNIKTNIVPSIKKNKVKYLNLSNTIPSEIDKPNNNPAIAIKKTGSSLIMSIYKSTKE